MTMSLCARALTLGVLVVAAATLIPVTDAHGAAPQRELDTRVLADDDGAVGPGFCSEAGCAPGQDAGGLDLLTLDVRETHLPNGEPAIGFRITFQSQADSTPGRNVTIGFKAGTTEKSLSFSGAGPTYNSTSCDLLVGPESIGDGHPKAIDCFVSDATLGVAIGDKLSAITVLSSVGTTKYDAMPGTWYSNGVLVQKVPDDVPASPSDVTDPSALGEYTSAGPAKWLEVKTSTNLAPRHTPATTIITISNLLKATDDVATVHANTTSGITAALDQSTLDLKANTTKSVTLSISKAMTAGTVNVTIVTSLGEYRTLLIPVAAPDRGIVTIEQPTHPTTSSTTTKKSPASSLVVGTAAIGLAWAVRRRR